MDKNITKRNTKQIQLTETPTAYQEWCVNKWLRKARKMGDIETINHFIYEKLKTAGVKFIETTKERSD